MVITSVSGVQYEVGKQLERWSNRSVFSAKRLSDGKDFVYRVYAVDSKDSGQLEIISKMKRVVKQMIESPLTGKDGKPLACFVAPTDWFERFPNGGFGYVVPLVDEKNFFSLKKLWQTDVYPDAYVICEVGKQLSAFFDRLHVRGRCYQEINEESILINPQTGEVRVTDFQNIVENNVAVPGNPSQYYAPEVYETGTVGLNSDKFALATYFYRLLVGGYPMDGKRAVRYIQENRLYAPHQLAKMIYGIHALFVFDPEDQSNTIRNSQGEIPDELLNQWKLQAERWDNLPHRLKECFVQTFSIGLKRNQGGARTTDGQWYDTFDHLQKTGLVQCQCGKHSFTGGMTCMFCGAPLFETVESADDGELDISNVQWVAEDSATDDAVETAVEAENEVAAELVNEAMAETVDEVADVPAVEVIEATEAQDAVEPSNAEESSAEKASDDTPVILDNDVLDEATAKAERIIAEAKAIAQATVSEADDRARKTLKEVEVLADTIYRDAKAKADGECANARALAEKLLDEAKAEAEKIREDALADAKGYIAHAQERGQKILADADLQAQRIRFNATQEAGNLLQTAKDEVKRLSDARKSIQLQMHNRNHGELMGKFTSMSAVMIELNEIMRSVEEKFTRTHTQTVFNQLYELYSIIADNRDYLSGREDYNQNVDLQIFCSNLEELMYMITEYLAEYGIDTVSTQSGAPFEGKYHNAVGSRNFNPNTAKIAKSLRSGFVWDEVVLSKEKVTVC